MKKLQNYFILLFSISFLLLSCEKEAEVVVDESISLSELLQNKFNSNEYKKALNYDFTVNWDNPLV